METINGTVLELVQDNDERYAVVAVDPGTACARCAAGRGCGAGLIGSSSEPRPIRALVAPDVSVGKGERVEVGFVASDLLDAALAVYGLPLLVAAPVAALAWSVSAGDVVTAAATLAGLAAGHWLGRRRLASAGCLDRLRPVIRSPSVSVSAADTP